MLSTGSLLDAVMMVEVSIGSEVEWMVSEISRC